MTNRPKSAPRSRLRFLDLSFDSKELNHVEQPQLNNGIRPHGGYRGTKRHPPGTYSFDKGSDYQKQLRDDLDRLFADEMLEIHGTPAWALEVTKEPTNSGESPLYINKVLSPSKLENEFGYVKLKRSCHSARSAPPSREGTTFYRPNRTHQYLTSTELKHDNADPNVKYGKPTRASLLRDRQRSGKTPVNAYELRRELVKRLSEIKNNAVVVNPKQFIQLYSLNDDNESLHSFLIGARYNSAHCLDTKSMVQHGVYMPRNNPLGCFVVKNKDKDQRNGNVTPPDYDEMSSPVTAPQRPLSAVGTAVATYSPVPTQRPRTAWVGSSHRRLSPNTSDNEGASENLSAKGIKNSPNTQTSFGPKLPLVKGVSVNKKPKQQREQLDVVPNTEQPPPTPVGFLSEPVDNDTLLREKSFDSKTSRRKKEMVDVCFNVPSIDSGDEGNVREYADMPYIDEDDCVDDSLRVPRDTHVDESDSRKVTFADESKTVEIHLNDGQEVISETPPVGDNLSDVLIDDVSSSNDVVATDDVDVKNPNIAVFITEGNDNSKRNASPTQTSNADEIDR